MPIQIDPAKVQFNSLDQVDKAPVYSLLGDSSGIGSNANAVVGTVIGPASSNSTVYMATLTNPYQKRCLMTLSWSIDRVNFYPANVPIFYFNPTYNMYLWRCLTFGGCSDSTVYVGFTTQYDVANQTVYVQFALDSPT
jgi:hypothetical protein